MQVVLIVTAIVLLLGSGAYLMGMVLPKTHVYEGRMTLPADVDRVWGLISDESQAPQWRSDIAEVERISPILVRETDWKGRALTFETVSCTPSQQLIRRIADEDLPFGGRWIFTLETSESGCILKVREEGVIYNPVFRLLAHMVFGHSRSVDRYLADLKRHIEPEKNAGQEGGAPR